MDESWTQLPNWAFFFPQFYLNFSSFLVKGVAQMSQLSYLEDCIVFVEKLGNGQSSKRLTATQTIHKS